MKRIITAVAVILAMAATSFSQEEKKKTDNEQWLDRYESLITRISTVSPDSVVADSVSTWRQERAYISDEYKAIYKDFLSDEEQKRYHSLTAQYNKCLTKFQLNDAGEQLTEVGDKVVQGAKKVGNKISGWIDGLKK